MNARTEAQEFVFFIVFVVVCGVTQPFVDALHIKNAIVNGIVTLAVFSLEIAAIEFVKRRVMGTAPSRYVAKAVLWTSFGVPALLFGYGYLAHVKFSDTVNLVIYLAITAVAAAIMCGAAARAPSAGVEAESS